MAIKESYIYGYHAVNARIKQNAKTISEVYLYQGRRMDSRFKRLFQEIVNLKIPHKLVERKILDSFVGSVVHQGIVAKVSLIENTNVRADLKQSLENCADDETILILDQVQDPANLGACLRTANALGIKHVILGKDKTAPISAVAIKAAAGSVDYLKIHRVTNLIRTLDLLKEHQFWIVGFTHQSESVLYNHKFNGRIALIMGNEGTGLRPLTLKNCDYALTIPMLGQVESLNVSVATAIAMYEVLRQRQN